MTTISIVGTGNMAAAIATRAAQHGHTIELVSRNRAKAQTLAQQIGHGATAGEFGATPAGEIVVIAVPHTAAVDVVTQFGDTLAGKILVDITNPFNADGTGVVTTVGNSVAQQIAAAAPTSAQTVKAFNMLFRGVIAAGTPVDVFFAGGSPDARARFAAFLESLDFRARDAGGLEMTYALEWASITLMGLARNGAGFDMALATEKL